ncbi:MAG: TIGR00282 family metallophosphoesterase [Caldiserica bacterium]|nr:TIGR00282 family metallophosphoesterase [Caldisericota bacterium]
MKILFVGDVIGKPGRECLRKFLPLYNKKADFCIVNGENAAGGRGITPAIAEEIFSLGVEVITTGNHIWDDKKIIPYLKEDHPNLLRPINYPPGVPGKGWGVFLTRNKVKVGIVNVSGRVFMPALDCPFRGTKQAVEEIKRETSCIIVDVHGEATSEKVALGYYLEGEVSAVIGTHTHVQTSDEKILPKGTAYITDVGMAGSYVSIIGMRKEEVMKHFLTQMPVRFKVAQGDPWINGVWIEIEETTGRALSIERIKERVE